MEHWDSETVLESQSINPCLFRMQLNGMYPELDQMDEKRFRDSPCLPSEKERKCVFNPPISHLMKLSVMLMFVLFVFLFEKRFMSEVCLLALR